VGVDAAIHWGGKGGRVADSGRRTAEVFWDCRFSSLPVLASGKRREGVKVIREGGMLEGVF